MEIEDNVLIKVTDADIKYGTFKIPNGVKKIGFRAFANCSKLISIDIPKSVEEIGQLAFLGCTELEKVNLTTGIIKIGSQAFQDCKRLNNIIIPDSVKEIGNFAFQDCKRLNNIIIPDSVEKIGSHGFGTCINLETITLSNRLNSIESNTFSDCINLKKVVIPPNVKCIKYYAFSRCYKLKLVLTSTLINIDESVFSEINAIQVGRTLIKSIEKFKRIRKKEILTKIKEKLKIRGINSKCYFKYEEHETFIKMMLNELNKGVYIDFIIQLNNYVDEFIKSKGLKIESNEVLSNSNMSNEIIVESNSIISQDSPIENIQQEKEAPQETDIKEILRKLSELPKEDIALIMDMAKNNIFDKNIERYINMSNEDKLKILESESESQQPYKVILEKEPIGEYKARQKVKKI